MITLLPPTLTVCLPPCHLQVTRASPQLILLDSLSGWGVNGNLVTLVPDAPMLAIQAPPPPAPSSSSAGLSSGDVAGIVVGSVVGAALLVGGAVLLLLLHRR